MKALLLNDWYMMKKYMRGFFLMLVLFIAVYMVEGNPFFLFFTVMFAGMIPVTLATYGESFHWDKYADAMPIGRRRYVSSKYVFALATFAAIMLICTVAGAVIGGERWAAFSSLLPLMILIALFSPALLLPFIFKFGAEKGRIAYFVAVGAMTALAMFVLPNEETTLGRSVGSMGGAMLILAAVVLFAVSWLLSVRFYENREL